MIQIELTPEETKALLGFIAANSNALLITDNDPEDWLPAAH